MAKEHILGKIEELERLGAEKLMEQTIAAFNSTLAASTKETFWVVLNIADDLKGGWTNFYATDFDSKFKLNALIHRKFCVPYFWTSESYSSEGIRIRTTEYVSRTLYRTLNPQPKTLEEHVEQEIYVATMAETGDDLMDETSFREIEQYYLANKDSEDYDRIFHFFYGDVGSESLGYKTYGITATSGFDFAKVIARRRKTTARQRNSK